MKEKKNYPNVIAFSMARIEVIERALKSYKERLVEDFRKGTVTDEEISIFASDLSKIDSVLEGITKGKNRISTHAQ